MSPTPVSVRTFGIRVLKVEDKEVLFSGCSDVFAFFEKPLLGEKVVAEFGDGVELSNDELERGFIKNVHELPARASELAKHSSQSARRKAMGTRKGKPSSEGRASGRLPLEGDTAVIGALAGSV